MIHAQTEVLGPFEIPENPEELAAFIDRCRDTIVRRLAELRGGPHAPTGSSPVAGNGESEGRALKGA